MTDPDTNQLEDPKPSGGNETRRRILVVGAATVVAAAGFLGVYGIEGLVGNQKYTGVCTPTKAMADTLKPRIVDDMSAVRLAYNPIKVSDLKFKDNDGADITLKAKEGKVLLVNLWATWCAPCRKEMPALDNLQRDLGGDDFEVVAINLDKRNPQKPRKFLKDIGVENLAFYSDAKNETFRSLKRQGRAFGLPATLLIDDKGCELGTLNGPAEWHSKSAMELVKAAVSLKTSQ